MHKRLVFFGGADRYAQAVLQGPGLVQVLDQHTISQQRLKYCACIALFNPEQDEVGLTRKTSSVSSIDS